MAKSRLYNIWYLMNHRCYNQNSQVWDHYGGRGIKVCDEWHNDFFAFREWAIKSGYSEDLTIDRIDNNGDYTPSNCRWITQTDQNRNRRNNRLLTYNGETKPLREWATIMGIPHLTLHYRITKLHWPVEQALTIPPRYNNKIIRKQYSGGTL